MAASCEMSSGSSGMLISPSKNRCLSPSNIWVLRFKHRSGLSAFLPPLTPIAEMSVISLFLLSSAMRCGRRRRRPFRLRRHGCS